MDNTQFSLDDIRRHPKFPFLDWKENDISFLMLELYWAELVRAALGHEMAHYQALFDTQRDGNPILDITNQNARRGLRLVMIQNEENTPPYPEKKAQLRFIPFTHSSITVFCPMERPQFLS